MEPLKVTYDPAKARTNLRKHGVSFAEAETIFLDPLEMTLTDDPHSIEEQRFISIGMSSHNRALFVVYTEDDSGVRLIGARVATATERHHYEEAS